MARNVPGASLSFCERDKQQREKMSQKAILFLCTGNYYRSRYAEELFNHLAKIKGLSWRAFSRGAAERGSLNNVGPMSIFVLDDLRAKGIQPEGAARSPTPCSLADIDAADIVIAVKESEHRPLVERRFPTAASKVKYWHVDDVEFVHPSIALAMLDEHVCELIENLSAR
ncbi:MULTISPECIES: low molecular weight phosphatase family protein [Bradyrhizobium]|uniref:arsenate-mycothiol transferase ArsC n=1 Tax=Bradyrhizobium TaxID=374 RepID=UPI001EDC670B|nr:low molecular weight phosphatase family protein [Bradyrhizobium zhengyangense]MCG2643612.1 low molecular weight phosphatase family protein [Bradyrhizobium zhengyangense]